MTITTELYNSLKEYKGEEFAALVLVAHGIHLNTKIKKKEWTRESSFSDRIEKRVRSTLHSYPNSVVDDVIDAMFKIHDWEIRNALGGLGGCEAKSFIEIVEE